MTNYPPRGWILGAVQAATHGGCSQNLITLETFHDTNTQGLSFLAMRVLGTKLGTVCPHPCRAGIPTHLPPM